MQVGAKCGRCHGGHVYFATCNSFTGSGHEWVQAIICGDCRQVVWTQDGCLDCAAVSEEWLSSEPDEPDTFEGVQ
jgi:hypothetical protein